MSWVDHIEGTLPADDLRRAFVEGVRWWIWVTESATMFGAERRAAEAAAEARYPDGKPPPSAIYRTPDIVIATVAGESPDSFTAIMDNPPYIQTDSYEIIKEEHDG